MSEDFKIGEKFISGKLVSLDEENVEKLDKMAKCLKQVETNMKENIISKISQKQGR